MTDELEAVFPNGPFDVIYADPPWAWGKAPLVNRGAARTVEKEYRTLQPDEIAALPVGQIASQDSVLFLWATSPKLQIALRVMEAWGFTYKTVGFAWVKRNRKSDTPFMGMGFYTRANVELCLLGTRGSLRRESASVRQLVESPIGRHSEKPEEVCSRIEELYSGPKIELFARRKRDGWASWGDEVEA